MLLVHKTIMKDVIETKKQLQYDLSQCNQENSQCNEINDISIMVHNKKVKIRKKINLAKYGQQPAVAFRISSSGWNKTQRLLTKHISMTEINKRTKQSNRSTRSSGSINKKSLINSKFVVNQVSGYHLNEYLNLFNFPTHKKWKVYRCQLSTPEDSCCCSCNSDAMFEVMKSLYDCYKKKNCDNCKCILCCHLLQEERRLGEEKKSLATLDTKKKKSSIKKSEKMLEGKTPAEKEEFLKELAKAGKPLPKGKTVSDKALIKKVKAELGVPKSKTATMLYTIKKDKASKVTSPTEKLKKATAAGLITPLEGKTPEQKEKILKGLAMQGLPLPEAKNASDKKLIDKVRADLALPPEPKTASMKEKYTKAASAGLLQPLEGKSPQEKERILQGLQDKGIPLPEARTASEKALIAKVKAAERALSVSPSVKVLKQAGLLTPLEGKTLSQKEKILKGLAKEGLPLPEAKTISDKKIAEKVRADLALPPEPKTASMKEKYAQAASAGLLQPLEGKSPQEKERILQGLQDKGIPLPEGRTASEKALITKVKAAERAPSVSPSVKVFKQAGLLTPLEGKTLSQKEKILKGLAKEGLPFPEAKSASDKKLAEKVRADLGLPPESKSPSMKEKLAKVASSGLLKQLEGKSPEEREKILKSLKDKGITLPEGRTPSKKSIVAEGERAPSIKPSTIQRKLKAAGLLTPLEGKTPSQKEKILKGLAKEGLPFPEVKSASDKKLAEKVRADLGLPPESKSPSMKEKLAKVASSGLLKQLEGKSPEEREKILKSLKDKGITLPEGRTATKKSIVAEGERAPSIKPSTIQRKLKAAGLLTPLEGKTPSQKEKILKGLAKEGLPFPEVKSASDKKLAEKVRADLGLPPESKSPSMKEKLAKVASSGLLKQLEGKSPEEREKILKSLKDKGITLPEGRTASKKSIVAEGERAPSIKPSTIQRKLKAAGLLTPLEGKTPSQKEKILKGLAKEGPPLPEAKSASDKKLIVAEPRIPIAAGFGAPTLPPEKRRKLDEKTAKVMKEGKGPVDECICGLLTPESEKAKPELVKEPPAKPTRLSLTPEKLKKAKELGLLTPLKGKTPSQKEMILKGLAKEGISLPEPKTDSEKKLIDKVRADVGFPQEKKAGKTVREPSAKKTALSITTEKLKKAKLAGLLTPLEGKDPEQKEKILKGLVETGLPLPEGKTISEKSLIKKLKTELGVPEKTPSEKIRKAKKSGLLTPLEGKTPSQKEKILRGRVAAGLPLPVGRTPSDRALIQKIKDDTGYVSPTPAERLERAKDAGLLTPLEGKSPSAKEKILRGRVAAGVPITEGKTPSEKEIVRKIAAGEPPATLRPSEKLKLAKIASEKAGKTLPEELIAKIKVESKVPSKVTSEKLRRAKEAGLLTPLSGKSSKKKEKILKGLIEQGLPLPESQTLSEKKIADKVRKEIGLPPEPKTLSEKTKMQRAEAAGIVTPLEGKTPSQKERIVRGMVAAGIPLPEGRTVSEKSMIKKVKTEQKLSAKVAAGFLTPLEGKTPSQKEKKIKSLAKTGAPLPEGKTMSEKELIRKAKDEGLLTPIAGKSPKEKDRILKGLAEAGLPMPEGETISEKELVKKVRAEAGLPLEPTPSEKRGEIRTKSRKSGVTPSKRRVKTIAAGISEKFEDVIKTTTCDRGCGCDKKKIKFKHSYVKIRVTSPDISSLCDCPNECIPGIKAGAFIDNEGIKVTVGRVSGTTSFTSLFSNHTLVKPKNVITLYDKMLTGSYSSNTSIDTVDGLFANNFDTNDLKKTIFDACPLVRSMDVDQLNINHATSFISDSYEMNTDDKLYRIEGNISNYLLQSATYETYNEESDRYVDCSRHIEPSEDTCRSSSFTLQKCSVSFVSFQIVKSESSLSLNTVSSNSIDAASVISLSNSSFFEWTATQYLYPPVSNGNFSNSTVEETERIPNKMNYSENDESVDDTMMSQVSVVHFNRAHTENEDYGPVCIGRKRNDFFTFLLSGTKLDNELNTKQISGRKTNSVEPLVVISNLDSEHDITTMVDQFLWKNEFSDASSIILLVPTSDNSDSDLSSRCSTICIQLSKHYPNRNQKQWDTEEPEISSRRNSSSTRGLKISAKGKKYCMEGMQETVASFHNKESMVRHRLPNYYLHKLEEKDKTKNKLCQMTTPYENMILCRGVSTDTTSDRPCCCAPKIHGIHFDKPENLYVPNAVSNLVTPLLVNPGVNHDGYYRLPKMNATQQVSIMSINRTPTSVSPCVIPPCLGNSGCRHSSEFLEIPFGTPVPKTPKPNTKPIAERTTELKPVSVQKQSEPCQCSPEKMKELFEQVLKGKPFNLKSTGCDAVAEQSAPKQVTICNNPQPTSDADDDEDCGKCSHHKYIKGHKMQCACSGKSKTIKFRPLCPCEQHQPPMSKTTAGPRSGTKSRGCQCCSCDLKIKGPEKDVLGPGGGVCQMDQGGTYCQAGQRPSTDPKKHLKDCACANGKRGKKNKNVICECPPEPEPEPEPEPYLYESYQWVDEKQVLRQKSDMTQTQSGFKMFKKKKPPVQTEPEFTVEDAVRYYVSMNPNLLKEFYPPSDDMPEKKKKNKDVICECPPAPPKYGVPPPTLGVISSSVPPIRVPTPPPVLPEDEAPSGGFKFSIGGKGSGSKGLSGVCCFDMIQETNISSIQHAK